MAISKNKGNGILVRLNWLCFKTICKGWGMVISKKEYQKLVAGQEQKESVNKAEYEK